MRRAAAAALLLALLAPPIARGQEDGVFVDPDSPAGKEYAVPLDQARREAGGAPGGPVGGAAGDRAEGEPLFGVGIEPQRGRQASSGSGETDNAGGGAGAEGDRGSAGGGAAGSARSARSTAAVAAASEEGSGVPLTIGIAGVVLAGGVAAGLGLRRLLRD